MITTHRPELADTIRILSLHGTSHDAWERYTENGKWYYEVVAHGFKYNLSDIHAALGIHQGRKLESFIATRARYAEMYNRAFHDLAEVELPPDNVRCRHAWHLYVLRLNLERLRIDRAEFIERLRQKRIGTSVHFIPIPLHPFFARMPLASHPCPRTLELYPRIVSLPLYPAMTEEQVDYVARSVKEVLAGARRASVFAAGSQSAGVSVLSTSENETKVTK
jgi:dTDP-4-amino-4,6-dideoxygalactose transaminase